MASITERLKFTGNYVDRLMSVDTMADLLSLNPSDNFNGQTVTVLKLYNRIPGDFWLVNGTASRYWRLKELPQVASVDILNQITQTCTLDTGKILIDNGFTASVKTGTTSVDYEFQNGEWIEKTYSGGSQGPIGPQGERGYQGFTGPQGNVGFQGKQGLVGPQGKNGIDGRDGTDGEQGPMGPQGQKGEAGERGPQGKHGIDGQQGKTGHQGPKGEDGAKGDQGPTGPQGPKGMDGETGPQGRDGIDGQQGKVGPQGYQGLKGDDGETGPQGKDGETGPQGNNGADGAKGDQGPTGPQGPMGIDGIDGEEGPIGPQGYQGLKGDDGETGPQGKDGETGPQGRDGIDGQQGKVGPQGPKGTDGADGEEGPIGPQGYQGKDGETGPQGKDGEKGDQGPQGIEGAQGNEGLQGPQGTTNIISASTAITIEDNTIGVNVAESIEQVIVSDNGKNYLRVTDNNELQVDGVDTDSSVIPSDIILEGGPLAELAKEAYPNGTIPSGTTMQDLLMKLFCQEKWGNTNGPTYTFNASVAAPTTNLNKSSYQPVGTIAVGSALINNTSANQYATVTGMTYGYSGTSHSNTGTTYTQTVTPTKTGDATISCSWTNLVPVDNSVDGSHGASKEFYIMNGTNTYRANVTGQTVTPDMFSEETIYALSNLGSVSESGATISEDGFEASSAYKTGITPTNSSSKTVTGYRPVYYGAVTSTSIDDNYVTENVLTGFGSSNRNVPTSYTVPTNSGAFIIAIPSGNSNYNKTNMVMKDSKGMSFGAVHVKTMTVNMLNNVETVNYKIFYITNANATTEAATYTITFE